jgi:outer membrane protein assembly factor BamB
MQPEDSPYLHSTLLVRILLVVEEFSNKSQITQLFGRVCVGMENFIGNGSIIAIDVKTGKVKWEFPTGFPTWVSPLVTNGVVFSGHITSPGNFTVADPFSSPLETPITVLGILIALDANTGTRQLFMDTMEVEWSPHI